MLMRRSVLGVFVLAFGFRRGLETIRGRGERSTGQVGRIRIALGVGMVRTDQRPVVLSTRAVSCA